MKLIFLFMTLMSIVFFNSSHPIILMVVILSQSILICLALWIFIKSSWFSYILFLIFLGGLMVLFIYIASLASNEKFVLKISNLLNSISACLFILAFLMITSFNKINSSSEWFNLTSSFNEMYSFSILTPTLITMVYLLLTLIVVVKISTKYEGPLRNMIFK